MSLYPIYTNVNVLDDPKFKDEVSTTSAGNAFWEESKSGRDLYNTQVGKFLIGGRKTNLMMSKNKIVNGMDDPSYLAFSFGITNVDEAGLFGDDITLTHRNNMLLPLNKDRSYSALTYLKNAIGNPDGGNEGKRRVFPKEYTELKKFVNGFKTITNDYPYMFQAIEGLTDAYKLYINTHKDSILGGGKDTKIKITCLETMDLRMAALFDSYFQSVYNHQYRRMNIPNNLLRFDCWVLLHDLRNVAQDVPELMGPIRSITPQITKGIISHLSTVLFLFKNCTLNLDEMGSTFDSISNKDNNETKFTFAFTYGDLEVGINSLADVFENEELDEAATNIYEHATDIITLNDEALLKRSPTKNFDDDMFDANYGINLDIGGTLKKIGSKIFHYATNGTPMGNVYDESWAGILSNMLSTISNASTSSIVNSVFQTGRMHAMNALSNIISGNEQKTFEDTSPGMNDNIYQNGNGGRDGEQPQQNSTPQITDLGSVDYQEPESDAFVPDNVYNSIPPSQPLATGNVYGNIPPYQPLPMNEHIDINAPSPNNLNVINVYQITTYSSTPPSGNAYGNVPETQPYYGEMIDLTSHSENGILVAESIDMESTNHDALESGNVYNEVRDENSKAQFHINVYDRIIESISNPIPIEKIFDTPREPQKLQKENVFPLIRDSRKETDNTENVYPKTQEQKTKLSNENVYRK
jgi:hypothetical protein